MAKKKAAEQVPEGEVPQEEEPQEEVQEEEVLSTEDRPKDPVMDTPEPPTVPPPVGTAERRKVDMLVELRAAVRGLAAAALSAEEYRTFQINFRRIFED